MSNKNTTPTAQQTATANPNLSNRTKAAIELYRRAYVLFGDILNLCGTFQVEDEEGRLEANFHDLEEVGCSLTKEIQDFIGFSAVLDQEAELENIPSTLLDGITKIEQ